MRSPTEDKRQPVLDFDDTCFRLFSIENSKLIVTTILMIILKSAAHWIFPHNIRIFLRKQLQLPTCAVLVNKSDMILYTNCPPKVNK